ncbi:hypothetical protein RH915_04055 [Serpentinicella sp. ANB-PHB4]|uniref:hypothetical protein n=1 Tax=Serpentinicella sp. ANB-PHB4 TaxID=3074076 RepID=UPI00285515BF|nr:hypothetical protein [Serpentinicella sp. ANB-PHB4]MDR5658655.1 hypothetical protein [Serpentinicella sp. ANB-PHB4]
MRLIIMIYTFFISFLIAVTWGILLFTGQVGGENPQVISVTFQLIIEGITVFCLFISGLLIVFKQKLGQQFLNFSLGLLLYSLLTSLGIYIYSKEVIPIIIFSLLLLTNIAVLIFSFSNPNLHEQVIEGENETTVESEF